MKSCRPLTQQYNNVDEKKEDGSIQSVTAAGRDFLANIEVEHLSPEPFQHQA